jgi:hypothetical protein
MDVGVVKHSLAFATLFHTMPSQDTWSGLAPVAESAAWKVEAGPKQTKVEAVLKVEAGPKQTGTSHSTAQDTAHTS